MLRHDAEQFRYLVALGRLPAELGEVAACYESVAAFLSEPNLGSPTAIVPRELAAMIRPTYDRLLHRPTAEAVPEGALNPRLDVGRIEADYLNGEIVRAGERSGAKTPANAAIVALVRKAEAAREGSPRIAARELARAVLHD